jgi:hypothetical protein
MSTERGFIIVPLRVLISRIVRTDADIGDTPNSG